MSNTKSVANTGAKKELSTLLNSDNVKNRLKEILGERASTFTTSLMQIVKSSEKLSQCEPNSIIGAAMTSATLDLPLNNNIGFAYIIPFNEKQKNGGYIQKAQFQLGYKGFIQLAQRSGQFKTLNVTEVKEGEISFFDRMTGDIEFNWFQNPTERNKRKTIGYVAYFRLLNGFEKNLFMTIEDLNIHAKKFSKTFKGGFGLWKDDFDSMAKKTVLKLLLSKYAPLSVEMRTAVITDQASFNDVEDLDNLSYVDNEEKKHDPDSERIKLFIEQCETQDDLDFIKAQAGEEHLELIKNKQKEINLKNNSK